MGRDFSKSICNFFEYYSNILLFWNIISIKRIMTDVMVYILTAVLSRQTQNVNELSFGEDDESEYSWKGVGGKFGDCGL